MTRRIVDLACREYPSLQIEAAGMDSRVADLCRPFAFSCQKTDDTRHFAIDAANAYQASGFELQLLSLSWNMLAIGAKVFEHAERNILDNVMKRGLVVSCPTVVFLLETELFPEKEFCKLLEMASDAPYPIKLLATVPGNPPASRGGIARSGPAIEQVLEAQAAINQAWTLSKGLDMPHGGGRARRI